jgi:hypothetical protein
VFLRLLFVTHCLIPARPAKSQRVLRATIPLVLTVLALTVPAASFGQSDLAETLQPASFEFEAIDDGSLEQAIGDLSSDSYATRQRATQRILSSGRRAVIPLVLSLDDPSLDVRIQAQMLIQQIYDREVDRELQRLLAFSQGDFQLPMWSAFCKHLGDDRNARQLYGELATRYRESLIAFSGDSRCHYRLPSPSRIDPQKLTRTDPLAWMLVLLVDLSRSSPSLGHLDRYVSLSTRLEATLSHPNSCPVIAGTRNGSSKLEQEGLHRLISAWVSDENALASPQKRLVIAMRYRCFRQAQSLCDTVVSRLSSEPRSIALALLTAATLDHPKLTDYLQRFDADQRVAHHFQLVGTPAALSNTQIRDVVLALRLRQLGVDPRDAGFTQLQADPTYVYSPISLGFSSDSQRNRCHENATLLIRGR